MANIYLLVPSYLAQFMRNRERGRRLTEQEPVVLPSFLKESAIMQYGLLLVPEQACEHSVCFSQRMWQNMLKGRRPQGGKKMIDRDQDEWLSVEEVNMLMGTFTKTKFKNCDYLCIQAPKTAMQGTVEKTVTPSYTLTAGKAYELTKELRTNFVYVLLRWVRNEQMMCDYKGIDRDVMTCIDHFFNHYNIMIGLNPTDRDSMRRMAVRWMNDAWQVANSVDDEDATFVYERERETQRRSMDKELKGVKALVKE